MSFLKQVVVGLIAWLADVAVFQLLWPVLGIAGNQTLREQPKMEQEICDR
jgi:hypothetical protein